VSLNQSFYLVLVNKCHVAEEELAVDETPHYVVQITSATSSLSFPETIV
jgi:hypothetical protein